MGSLRACLNKALTLPVPMEMTPHEYTAIVVYSEMIVSNDKWIHKFTVGSKLFTKARINRMTFNVF